MVVRRCAAVVRSGEGGNGWFIRCVVHDVEAKVVVAHRA